MTDDIKDIISQTVDQTVLKLKMAGLMKNSQQSAAQKTEYILRNYNNFKKAHSEDDAAKKFITIIDAALAELEDDPYYNLIPLIYFEGYTREEAAEYFDTTVTTISRNKRRLLEKLKLFIFADDVVYELFL